MDGNKLLMDTKFRALVDIPAREINKGDILMYDHIENYGYFVTPKFYPLLHMIELRILLDIHPDWFEEII